MTNTTPLPRKSSQETEIDHLLAEEFHCDSVFAKRFAEACGLKFASFQVIHVTPEPSLGGDGYGDLLVTAEMDGRKTALLIEDKITAGAATRQAERYSEYAKRMRQGDYEIVTTVLVAPGAYRGERDSYDVSVSLEAVMEMLRSPDSCRLNWRRGIIERALRKNATTGVQVPDLAMRQLHADYQNWAGDWCNNKPLSLEFPELKAEYYDGDNWVDRIRHPAFPANVWLRHRLWTSNRDMAGMVDLVVSPTSEDEQERLNSAAPDWAIMTSYGKKGVKLSIRVPEMRQSTGFCENHAEQALLAMSRLISFFLGQGTEDSRTTPSWSA